MDSKIRVVIVDDIEETRNNITTLLQFNENIEIVGEAENGEEAVTIANQLRPDIMLMDINMPVKDGIKATEEISVSFPEVSVVIVSVQEEQEYLRKAMTAGARDFITKPFSGDDLVNTIVNTYDLEQKRKEKIIPKQQQKIETNIITVFSTKGGIGKTALASNIAVACARETGSKVALLDLDLQFGDIGVFLNVPIKNTIVDLVKETNDFSNKIVEEYMVSHYSDVNILLSPIKPEYAEFITAEHVEKIINCLKDNYHYVIIDTPTSLSEVTLTSLDLADKVMFVTGLDLPSIRNTKEGLEVMESLNYTTDKLKLVLNKVNEQFGIKIKDFEDTINYPIWSSVPEDAQTVMTSINKGFPFVLTRSETKVAKSILDIVQKLGEYEQPKQEQKGLFKSLFNKN